MVPITRRASSFNKKCGVFLLIINQYRSMPAVIVQDTFAGEAGDAKRRRLEATSTATSTGTFTAQARKSSIS